MKILTKDGKPIIVDGKMITVDEIDIQINGQSIIADGVANIPLGTPSVAGVVRPAGATYGVSYQTNGTIAIASATQAEIDAKNNSYKPIVPSTLDYAVKSVVDKPWTLKGTLNTDNKDIGVDVDLTGYTELILKVMAETTENTFLFGSGNKYMWYLSSRKQSGIALYKNLPFGIIPEFVHSNDNLVFGTLRPSGYGYVVMNAKIDDITRFYFQDSTKVTSCTIEIYAR